MRALSRALLVFGILCFLPFLIPTVIDETIPGGTRHGFALGLPQSPWFVSSKEETRKESENGSFSTHFSSKTGVEFLSCSWLFPLGSWAAFAIRRKLNARAVAKT
jgi:hypothetical protein